MTVQEIVETWGISFPKEEKEDLYLPEFLLEKFPSKCFFIDFFPKTVSVNNGYNYGQLEEKAVDLICDRTYLAFLKLWVYDNLYFESELLYKKGSSKKYFMKRKLLKELTTNCVESVDHLKTLWYLSKKNIIDIVFVFEKSHMVIVPSWTGFFLFVENDLILPLLKDIFISEGLFLRDRRSSEEEFYPHGNDNTIVDSTNIQ